MILLFFALFVTGPFIDQGSIPTCLLVDKEMAQSRPCKPEEFRK